MEKTIRIIHNENNRIERLFNLFSSINKAGYGKLDDKYFCIDSTLMFEPKNEDEYLFVLMQKHSYMNGFKTVCYSLKNYKQ